MDKKPRVLLILISEQTIPNLLSIHHYKPDVIIPIETPFIQKKGVLRNVINSLTYSKNSRLSQNIKINHDLVIKNEDSLREGRQVMEKAFNLFPDAQWIVNLTGGTKPMSLSAYDFFKNKDNARLIYINVRKPDLFLNLKDEEQTENNNYKLSINEFISVYGFEPQKSDNEIDQSERVADQLWDLSREIAENYTTWRLIDLNEKERSDCREEGMTLELRHIPNKLPSSLKKLLYYEIGYNIGEFMDKDKMIFLTGGWLETFMYELLKRHKTTLGIQDIHMGVWPGRSMSGGSSGIYDGSVKNDLDVAFIKDYTLYNIECKTGIKEKNNPDGDSASDILYKVKAIREQLKALRIRNYLVTPSEVLFNKGGDIKSHIQDRADLYECPIITRDQIVSLAKNHDDPSVIKKTLSL